MQPDKRLPEFDLYSELGITDSDDVHTQLPRLGR